MTSYSKPLTDWFEQANGGLAHRTRAMLARCAASAPLHARLLNMLSLLEHMGARRIAATQSGPGAEECTLRHVAEEARHASFFRRQAERTAGRRLTWEDGDLLAPAAARMYFRRLEARVTRAVSPASPPADPRLPYLYMAMTIEFRALWLYRLLDSVEAAALSLRSVLAEEQGHLEQMAARLEELGRFDRHLALGLCEREGALYCRLLGALERDALTKGTAPPRISPTPEGSTYIMLRRDT